MNWIYHFDYSSLLSKGAYTLNKNYVRLFNVTILNARYCDSQLRPIRSRARELRIKPVAILVQDDYS